MSVRITNYGLDAVAKVPSHNSSANTFFTYWSPYTAVGTGSALPSQTDVALENEVARTDYSGGASVNQQFTTDTSTNTVRAQIEEYRIFDFTTSYNLTEYGHFTSSSGANCVFRDLFRQDPNDPNSAPIVISVQSGDQLQIIKTVIIEIPWVEETYSIVISGMPGKDGNGTHDVVGTFFNSSIMLKYGMTALWPGGYRSSTEHGYIHLITSGGQSTTRSTGVQVSGNYAMTADPYIDGTYTRTKRYKFLTGEANGTLYGFAVTYDNSTSTYNRISGYKMFFQNPSSITKQNTHTLEMVFQMTWGRG